MLDFQTVLAAVWAAGFTEITCFRGRKQIIKRIGDM